jgi:hypothetical protein
MFKYLYVLVSDENDYYLEQALMSITTLKMYTPDAYISLLIDDSTEKTLIGIRGSVLELINELIVEKIEGQFNKKARSRWLKTSMRLHIKGDFLFIDCDTIICSNLHGLEDFTADLGAVLDLHLLLQDSPARKRFQNRDKKLGFNTSYISDKHYNSGVIFCKDNTICHSFFAEWHSLWVKGYTKSVKDQPSFNQTNLNFKNIIEEMQGVWNCQIRTGGIVYLNDAKIIHYFSNENNAPYALADPSVLQEIKKSGIINEDLRQCLFHPKSNFYSNTQLLTDKNTIDILRLRSFKIFSSMYNWGFFQIFEKILEIFSNIRSNLKTHMKH